MSNCRLAAALALICLGTTCYGEGAASFDAAAAFGARQGVEDMHLSPDGMNVAYIAPAKGQGSIAYTLSLAKGSVPNVAVSADGKPYRLDNCRWVSNDRLVCVVYATMSDPIYGSFKATRLIAVDADGKNQKLLSTRDNPNSGGYQLWGGGVIDWLPDENGAVLMARLYRPDDELGTRLASTTMGLGVDWIDTRTLTAKRVEPPRPDAVGYISDGRGTVRIVAWVNRARGTQDTGIINFSYRLPGSRDWLKLSDYNENDRSGFYPLVIDHDRNVVYGFKKKDGRMALYSVTLDESRQEELVYERPDVDISALITIGRRNRPVGTAYATDTGRNAYFAPDVRALVDALGKALAQRLVDVSDSSVDENRMSIFSSSDVDAGVYHIFDRKARQLQTFLVARAELEGVKLARVKFITYPAADGTSIPAYLTLPPGKEDAKGLPAIVLPHSGLSNRDEWGFDWLSQFFAARGCAVLQPNFRGSGGYGDAWLQKNGFKSWQTAIGDVSDGGRWLIHEGIANPSQLAIVGWSYGGYAALQSAVVDQTLFKAVVAIAPVTDLAAFKEAHRNWTDFEKVSNYVGSGPVMHEGSPIEHVDKIKVPVLLFHGGRDAYTSIEQSKSMAARLKSAGASCELVSWDDLDHYFEDSAARTQMLRKSDEFLRKALGM